MSYRESIRFSATDTCCSSFARALHERGVTETDLTKALRHTLSRLISR